MVRGADPGKRKIIVIDNDPSVHETISRFLKVNQDKPESRQFDEYSITSADSGLSGIEVAAEAEMSGKPFAVAFVGNIASEALSQADIISRIRQDCPDIEIVVLIDFASDGVDGSNANLTDPGQFLVLRKSFGVFELQQMVGFLIGKWNYKNTIRQTYDKICHDQNQRVTELESANLRLQQEVIIQGRKQEMFEGKFTRYRNLFDHADCPLIVTSGKRQRPAGIIIEVNQRLCQLCDYTSAELKAIRFEDLFHCEQFYSDPDSILSGYLKTRSSETIPANIRSRNIIIGRDSVVVSAAFVSVPSPIFQ